MSPRRATDETGSSTFYMSIFLRRQHLTFNWVSFYLTIFFDDIALSVQPVQLYQSMMDSHYTFVFLRIDFRQAHHSPSAFQRLLAFPPRSWLLPEIAALQTMLATTTCQDAPHSTSHLPLHINRTCNHSTLRSTSFSSLFNISDATHSTHNPCLTTLVSKTTAPTTYCISTGVTLSYSTDSLTTWLAQARRLLQFVPGDPGLPGQYRIDPTARTTLVDEIVAHTTAPGTPPADHTPSSPPRTPQEDALRAYHQWTGPPPHSRNYSLSANITHNDRTRDRSRSRDRSID